MGIMDQRSVEIVAATATTTTANNSVGRLLKEKRRSNIPPALNGNVKYASGSSWKNVGLKVQS